MVVLSARHQQALGSNPSASTLPSVSSCSPQGKSSRSSSSATKKKKEEEEKENEEPKEENEREIVCGGCCLGDSGGGELWVCALNPVSEETGVVGSYGCVWSFLSLDHNGSFLFFFIIFPFFQGKIALSQFTDKGLDYMLCLSPLVAHGVFRIDGRRLRGSSWSFRGFF